MKKMLKAFSGLAVACLLIVGLCMTVLAADSPEVQGPVSSDNPNFFALLDQNTVKLTEAEARTLIGHQDGTVVVTNWEMGTTDNSEADVTFTAEGAVNSTLYVFHYTGGEWRKEKEGKGPEVTNHFATWSPVALVVYTPGAAPGPSPEPQPGPGPSPVPSPKTGETNYFLFAALAAIIVGGVAAGVAVRKNKA